MNNFLDLIRNEREYQQILQNFISQSTAKKPLPMLVSGLCEGALYTFCEALISDLRQRQNQPLVLFAPDEKTSNRLLSVFIESDIKAHIYPYRDFIFHNITASHEFEHERLSVLCKIIDGDADVIITTPDAALQYTIPFQRLARSIRTLTSNDKCDISEFIPFLEEAGYVRSDLIDGVGQYSLRGGIIDLFPPDSDYPVRIDLFDEDIDSLSHFDIMTQRRIEPIEYVNITPAREILLGNDARDSLIAKIKSGIKKAKNEQNRSALESELEALSAGTETKFIDKYISLIYPERQCLLDYFGDNPTYIMLEKNKINERLTSFEWHLKQSVSEMLEGGIDSKIAEYGKWKSDFDYFCSSNAGAICEPFVTSVSEMRLSGIFSFISKQTVSYADNFDLLFEDLITYLRNGYLAVLLCENELSAKQLHDMLDERGITLSMTGEPKVGVPGVIYGKNLPCFELSASKFVSMSLYANPNSYSRSTLIKGHKKVHKKSAQERIMSYADLETGDYVVHETHGIGQYLGLQSLSVEGIRRDFVKIKYADKDMLYLPCDQLDSISKYIGARAEDGTLKLSKMGGGEWVKAKTRAKKAASDMAKELITLYAKRLRLKGFAFDPDDEFQRTFEAGFEYEETEGQLTAVEDIKRDMEKSYPMDRLLCGDVGFGKTEVALRAAFKCVNNSKQVAILVPTTILAMQHYQTILSRMRGFPIKVDILSRFRTNKQQQETIRRLRRGEVDIIVGTHRILSDDVKFKDLGLIIVDEEQRFGVAQKEKLKKISENIDSLTLTATPIPRTLNMAMSGIRDMSVLEEAPGDRFPVQTYVLEYDDLIIAEAIRKELRRGGQVFYLYNRVENINNVAAKVLQMVPDAKIAVAHGQMDKEELSEIWRKLVVGEIDILVSTTIIETGVDVPNANTLVIENADCMGLSQLHQIRGRVGRSPRRAYAYFTYPKGKVISEISAKRLSAIRDYTEFGSGFKIALRDLEIRGAGNILGAEQHGHIESVGYDLYMKILNRAILEEKGEVFVPKPECTIDVKFDAFIPEKYIESAAQRIDAYKKIAAIENEEDLRDITDELLDRYGNIPRQLENLLNISLIRGLGREIGIERITQNGTSMLLYPNNIDVRIWTLLAGENKGKLLLSLSSKPYITLRINNEKNPLGKIIALLIKYIQIRDNKAEK